MDNNQQEQNKGDKLDEAIKEMTDILGELGEMFLKVKKMKYSYLTQTCDIYSRVDFPSVLMDSIDREIKQLPTSDSVRKGTF